MFPEPSMSLDVFTQEGKIYVKQIVSYGGNFFGPEMYTPETNQWSPWPAGWMVPSMPQLFLGMNLSVR